MLLKNFSSHWSILLFYYAKNLRLYAADESEENIRRSLPQPSPFQSYGGHSKPESVQQSLVRSWKAWINVVGFLLRRIPLRNYGFQAVVASFTLVTIYTNTGLKEDTTPRSLSIETPNNGKQIPPTIINNPPKIDFARKKDIGIDYKLILLAGSSNHNELNAFLKESSDYKFYEEFKKAAFKIAVKRNLTLNVSTLIENGIFYPEFFNEAKSGLMEFLLKLKQATKPS